MENFKDSATENVGKWQAPQPPPNVPTEEQSQMSEVGTLGNIFLEPGDTFEDLRRKPRFIYAAIIICLLTTAFFVLFQQKMGEERYRRFFQQQMEKSSQMQGMPAEQKESTIAMQLTFTKYLGYAIPLFLLIGIAIGSLAYWLAVKAVVGSMNFLQAVSVWVYSSFPVTVVSLLANLIVLFLKSPDEIDIATAGQRGLVQANPSFFIDGKESPALAALLANFDLFLIWGWILAVIGLQRVGKISSGAAWAIVIIFALIGVTFKVIQSLFS